MPITLHTCEKLARVLGKSDRFLFCESGFRFYGGSIEAIAQSRGLSQATVSRHLSNGYRLVAAPIRGFRQELPPIIKKQLVEPLPRLQNMPPKLCVEDGLFLMSGKWWKPHCNVYLINISLLALTPQSVPSAPTETCFSAPLIICHTLFPRWNISSFALTPQI
jgi:hypothetical protein